MRIIMNRYQFEVLAFLEKNGKNVYEADLNEMLSSIELR